MVISQYIGNQNQKEGNLSVGQLLTLSLLLSCILAAAVLIWNKTLLRLLFGEGEKEVMNACITYLRISAYSYPALAVYEAGAAMCRSMGKTDITMYLQS